MTTLRRQFVVGLPYAKGRVDDPPKGCVPRSGCRSTFRGRSLRGRRGQEVRSSGARRGVHRSLVCIASHPERASLCIGRGKPPQPDLLSRCCVPGLWLVHFQACRFAFRELYLGIQRIGWFPGRRSLGPDLHEVRRMIFGWNASMLRERFLVRVHLSTRVAKHPAAFE